MSVYIFELACVAFADFSKAGNIYLKFGYRFSYFRTRKVTR